MTDIAIRDDGAVTTMPDKIAYARALAGSGLLPTQYRAKPENILFALEYGETLGITAMAAIQGIHVIDGKPTASGQLIAALVREAGHRLRITGDDEHAVAEITRRDDPAFTFRAEWTIARAKQAGLTGKGTWAKHPGQMLKWRAVTEVARDACPEVIFGLSTADEAANFTADTLATAPVTAAELTGAPAVRDWHAEITALVRARDLEGLGALYRQAKGHDDVRARITAAAERVKAAGHIYDVTYAEVVDEPDPQAGDDGDRTDEYVQVMADEDDPR